MVILKLLNSDDEIDHSDDSERSVEIIEIESDEEDMQLVPLPPVLTAHTIRPTAAFSGEASAETIPLTAAVSGKEFAGKSMKRSTAVYGEECAGESTMETRGSKRAAQDEFDVNTSSKKRRRTKKNEKMTSSGDTVAVGDEAVAEMVASEEAGWDQENQKSLGAIKRVFTDEDEIAILKGVIEFRAKTGLEPKSDSDAFYESIKDSLHADVSKKQVMGKLGKLMKKFSVKVKKRSESVFCRSHDSLVFELSKEIWGKREAKRNNAAVAVPEKSGFPSQNVSEENQQVADMECEISDANKCEMEAEEAKNASNEHKERTNVEVVAEEAKNASNEHEELANVEMAAEEAKNASSEHEEQTNVESEKASDEHREEHLESETDEDDAECEVGAEEPNDASKENQKVANVESKNDKGLGNADVECDVGGGGNGKETCGSDANEFLARYAYLKDAVDTTLSNGPFNKFPKGLLLDMVKGMGEDKGKALDEKWMNFRFEEMQLEVRKQKFLIRFSKIVLDALQKK